MFAPFRLLRNLIWTIKKSVDDVASVRPNTLYDFAVIFVLTLPVPVLESVGLTMVLPLIDFIDRHGDVSALEQSSAIWRYLKVVYGGLGLPIELWSLSLVLLVLLTLRQTLQYLRVLVYSRAKYELEAALRNKLIRSALEGQASDLQRIGVGKMADLSTQQVIGGAGVVIRLFDLIGSIWTLIVFGIGLLLLAPAITVATGLAIGLVGLLFAPVVRLLRKLSAARVAQQQLYGSWFVQRLLNWKTVKLFGTMSSEIAQAGARNKELVNIGMSTVRVQFLASAMLTVGGFAMILFALNVVNRHEDLRGGTLYIVILAAIRLLPLVQSLVDLVQGLVSNSVSLDSVLAQTRRFERSREDVLSGKDVPVLRDAIRFEAVEFRYRNARQSALDKVSVSFPARTVTVIAGHSGAGKSTMIDLLPALIEPTSGRLTYDNVPFREFSRASLRREITVLEQSPSIFHDTIFENIRYGRPSATMEEVTQACKRAGALEFIMQTPDGFDTRLGEDGAGLSGGQLQRIALARALLSRARILVLDEPTSSIDSESEQIIFSALRSAADEFGLTIIMITHRETPTWFADRKIVLDQGRIRSIDTYNVRKVGAG
jgi:ABC-type multidrug transport system fused ATPase/permease subunit